CRLYAGPDGFPKKLTHKLQQFVPIRGPSATCRFTGIAPGTYAVAVVHDENNNGQVDTNFLGVPTEGYGVSNNRTYALSLPKWDESKIQVREEKDVVLNDAVRYLPNAGWIDTRVGALYMQVSGGHDEDDSTRKLHASAFSRSVGPGMSPRDAVSPAPAPGSCPDRRARGSEGRRSIQRPR